jgi:hypothetical protein
LIELASLAITLNGRFLRLALGLLPVRPKTTFIGTNFDSSMEQYYEKLKTVPFFRTRNRPSYGGRCYDIWDADAGHSSQTSFEDGDDRKNYIQRSHEASTLGGGPPSPTILDA